MSKIKPMILVDRLSGKVCSHSNTYFAERYGTQYTGTICNPYTGEPTDKQIAVREKFADTIEAINNLTEEQREAYKEAFKKQKKYRSLRGYIFAQEYKKLN
ncbi:MAG: hypothetical protein IJV81_00755 [Paludibacteraceae bacterium]|nr:hypothetical protein [Paludibacteraceae bacterium]